MSLVNSKKLRGRTRGFLFRLLLESHFRLVVLRPAGRIMGGGDNVSWQCPSPSSSVELDLHAEITGEEVTVVTLQAEWRWGVWEYRASLWFHISFHLASPVDCPFVYFCLFFSKRSFSASIQSLLPFISSLRFEGTLSVVIYIRLPYQKRFLLLVFDRFLPTRNICLQIRRGTVPWLFTSRSAHQNSLKRFIPLISLLFASFVS